MRVEDEIYGALKSLVGNRVAWTTFPQAQKILVWPAIRGTIVSNIPFNDLLGDFDEETPETRLQLDAVAETFTAARALALQIIPIVLALSRPWLLESGPSSEFDSETKTHKEILEFSSHASSDSGNSPP